ncbi:coiled-coil domain-containing protein 96 [Dunckerocampus dactyliophorus]|uniref:coiled-coil domain-containing protein 96 n=1 Tax=Dunckerocampus dactyliophorus TaxID=161453 RepID=UPI002406DB64|nr:coiled-coil domain-containing protein 96 [Dunckerocampus dactyliophorus]
MDEESEVQHEDHNEESQDLELDQRDTTEPCGGADVVTRREEDDTSEKPARIHQEKRKSPSPLLVEDAEDTSKLHEMHGLQELQEQEDKVSRHNLDLQAKLAFYFSQRTPEKDTKVDGVVSTQDYDKCLNFLVDWRRQHAAQVESARQQEDELRLHSQEELDKVEDEWQALLALKRKLAVSLLSRHLGQEAAQAKVEAVLASERVHREELRRLRVKHVTLKSGVERLEAGLRNEEEEQARDHLQLQFEQLLANRMQQRKVFEQKSQEALKLHKKMKCTLELLSNMKEKLHWSRMEVLSKREQLAQLDATLAAKRDLLNGTKRACSRLQRNNVELKHGGGLLGHRLLLWDFGVTVGASELLEDKLDKLKCRREEIVSTNSTK